MIWIKDKLSVQRAGMIIIVAALTTLRANAQEGRDYRYDALGRLVGVQTTASENSVKSTYAYDKAGNRSNVTVTTSGVAVPNGDFEDPSMGPQSYTYLPIARSLTLSGNAGLAANGSAWGFPRAWSGNQVAFIQSGGGAVSFVELRAINLTVGRRYRFAFAAARRPGYPENAMRIYIDGNLIWNGPPETAERFTPHPTQAFLAQAPTATIRFETTPTSYDSSSGIDAISIQEAN